MNGLSAPQMVSVVSFTSPIAEFTLATSAALRVFVPLWSVSGVFQSTKLHSSQSSVFVRRSKVYFDAPTAQLEPGGGGGVKPPPAFRATSFDAVAGQIAPPTGPHWNEHWFTRSLEAPHVHSPRHRGCARSWF